MVSAGTDGSQLAQQQLERRGIVDIIPGRQFDHLEAVVAGTGTCLLSHLLGTPRHILEQAGMGCLHPDQVIAAIPGRPQHDPVPGFSQHPGRAGQKSRR